MLLVIDRLYELRNLNKKVGRVVRFEGDSSAVTSPGSTASSPTNTMFFTSASLIQSLLAKLLNSIKELSAERCRLYTITTSEEESESLQKLQDCTQAVNEALTDVRESLKDLQDLANDEKNTSEGRIRLNVYNTLVKRFRDSILKFQREQSEIADAKRSRAVRLLQISAPGKLSHEEAESLVVIGVTHDMAMMDRMCSTDLEVNLSSVRERVRDLHAVENSIADLNQMFQEMANLIIEQGEVLDSIEYAVVNVKNYTNLSAKSLVKAKQKQRGNMKLILCIVIACILLVAVIIIPIFIANTVQQIFNKSKPAPKP